MKCTEVKKMLFSEIYGTYFNTVAGMEQGEGISLLAKWLPSINASSRDTRKKAAVISTSLGMDYAAYRKTLSRLRAYPVSYTHLKGFS